MVFGIMDGLADGDRVWELVDDMHGENDGLAEGPTDRANDDSALGLEKGSELGSVLCCTVGPFDGRVEDGTPWGAARTKGGLADGDDEGELVGAMLGDVEGIGEDHQKSELRLAEGAELGSELGCNC